MKQATQYLPNYLVYISAESIRLLHTDNITGTNYSLFTFNNQLKWVRLSTACGIWTSRVDCCILLNLFQQKFWNTLKNMSKNPNCL